ncbi:PE family protein, partial [Mycobacterium sp.]|uniref:PE family protein n=1 Tax=Mycobacterium sp. TaxID=1785 RepID=UPI003C774B6D
MSFAFLVPEYVTGAATDLADIGTAISSANSAALGPTSNILAAGADEVSASVAALFGSHAEAYQALSAQAEAFHERFLQTLNGGASAYAAAETTNAEQVLLDAINAPTQTLLGRPLIGDGTNGAPGSGANGGAGGLLWG